MGIANCELTWRVIGRTVCGASHSRNGTPLQDAIRWSPVSGNGSSLILAMADGHGSAPCVRSKAGAEIAVETATVLLQEFFDQHPQYEKTRLQRSAEEMIPKELVRRWRQAVARDLEKNPLSAAMLEELEASAGKSARRALEADVFLAYGSTILSALVTPSFVLYFQLGDGDILFVSASGETSRPWPRDPRLLGVETTSLCTPAAWNEVRLGIRKITKKSPALVLLCTDGYSNSFREEVGFLNVGRDLLEIIRADGLEKVSDNLETWLTEASDLGSGDDITLGILCRKDERAP